VRKLQITAGATFIAAWIVGLILANGGPEPGDPGYKIANYFAAHEGRSIVATMLIDGLAGAALLGIAYSLYLYLEQAANDRLRRSILVAGVLAGVTSFIQAGVGVTLAYRAAHGSSPDTAETLFKVLNNLDTVKIVLLAIMIASASLVARRFGAFPGWLASSGLVFAPLLAISGLAFPLESDALYSSLAVTLILLLLWVASVTVVVAQRTGRSELAGARA
jgi:hypothetical protein